MNALSSVESEITRNSVKDEFLQIAEIIKDTIEEASGSQGHKYVAQFLGISAGQYSKIRKGEEDKKLSFNDFCRILAFCELAIFDADAKMTKKSELPIEKEVCRRAIIKLIASCGTRDPEVKAMARDLVEMGGVISASTWEDFYQEKYISKAQMQEIKQG